MSLVRKYKLYKFDKDFIKGKLRNFFIEIENILTDVEIYYKKQDEYCMYYYKGYSCIFLYITNVDMREDENDIYDQIYYDADLIRKYIENFKVNYRELKEFIIYMIQIKFDLNITEDLGILHSDGYELKIINGEFIKKI